MSGFDDIKVFGDKSLADLFKQIHKNNKDVDKQINELIDNLKPLVNNAGSAVMLMPTVKDLIDVNVRNNDQLVKMASIVQRAATSQMNDGEESFINYDEIQKIISEQQSVVEQAKQITDHVKQIENK
jgi:hypothetical protein